MSSRQQLESVAYDLAEEIRDGKWNHVEELHKVPVPRCQVIMDEFKRRCPGFTLADYQKAIADGLFASR